MVCSRKRGICHCHTVNIDEWAFVRHSKLIIKFMQGAEHLFQACTLKLQFIFVTAERVDYTIYNNLYMDVRNW